MNRTTEQTPEERFQAVLNVTISLQDEFLTAGELLHEIKKRKQYSFAGYNSFKDFVEDKYSITSSFANKLSGVYETYVAYRDYPRDELSEIGLDKLHLVKFIMKSNDDKLRVEWWHKLNTMTLMEIAEEVKDYKKSLKDALPMDMKKVLVEQWKEQYCELFSCKWTELQFKLALWFMSHPGGEDWRKDFKTDVRELQQKFEKAVIDNEGNAEKASEHMTDAVKMFQQTCQDISDKNGATISLEFGEDKVVVSTPTQDIERGDVTLASAPATNGENLPY